MRVLVLGAAGGVGRHAVRVALARGHEVVAASRSGAPHAGAEVVAVDVRDPDAVARVVDGADAVLWCVGVTKRSGPGVGRTGMTHLVQAARLSGLRRVVTVSGAGVTLPGDDKSVGARAVSALTRRLARELVADKEAEHAALADSGLAWTQVRPPRLTEADPTGRWELTTRAPGPTARPVPKADVASAMLELGESENWLHASPFLVTG